MLILASASPRRRELLAQAGFSFTVESADVNESLRDGEEPTAYMLRLAVEKAQAVFARHSESSGAPSMTASSSWVGSKSSEPQREPAPILTLNRTDYPSRDLSILDILPAGCSKGAALLSLAATRGIDPGRILAIGDNWNDVSMLEAAGAAVLMDNAPEDLKVLARARGWHIGPSNRDDGVAQAIEAALAVTC
jgi:hypothetical protein